MKPPQSVFCDLDTPRLCSHSLDYIRADPASITPEPKILCESTQIRKMQNSGRPDLPACECLYAWLKRDTRPSTDRTCAAATPGPMKSSARKDKGEE